MAGAAFAQPVFQSPLAVPAVKSALAIQAPLNALATAGQRIVAAGQRGHILYSDDGKAWTQAEVPLSTDFTALSFPSAKKGWAVGHQGAILHTTDGGATWSKQFLAENGDSPFLDVWFEDEQRGFAIGAFNLILRTEDGGKSWKTWDDRVDNPRALHLYAIRPAGGSVFIVGEQGLVLKLDRHQQRFVNVPLPYRGTLFGVVDTSKAILVFGLRGNAFRSIDGGTSWTKVETGVAAGLVSGAVLTDGTLVLASQAGHVLMSKDDGATFTRVQVSRAAPAFAVMGVGKESVALAGIGGVRVEAVK